MQVSQARVRWQEVQERALLRPPPRGVLGSSSLRKPSPTLARKSSSRLDWGGGAGGRQEFRPRQREGLFLKTQVSADTFCHQDCVLCSCGSSRGSRGASPPWVALEWSLKAGRKLSVLGLACLECLSVHVPTQQGVCVCGTTQFPSCRTERGIGSPSRTFKWD